MQSCLTVPNFHESKDSIEEFERFDSSEDEYDDEVYELENEMMRFEIDEISENEFDSIEAIQDHKLKDLLWKMKLEQMNLIEDCLENLIRKCEIIYLQAEIRNHLNSDRIESN
ncbi:hypothetical protein SSS_00520 [Sarcoptes scabiei]|uniref:Uncharacterized protein n=1 Tax=Sarcoptes scabiei TaxID=52283 RepID=A0A132A1B3_SARSC|nr:hypothetical protein SSS_00520 [Sarcoptes scabiei]KPM04711.1 hypothetical protein QR98_0031640 [Sarcoptes scabiei]